MARWLVFTAWTADDATLWNSRWIAEQTVRLAPDAPNTDDDEYLGLHIFAQQLVDRMVVSR